MNKIELLSPAGNFECFKAAINYGADAVYLGGQNFSARNFADNFSFEEIKEAINYAHIRNVKVYITMNTLLNDYELDKAIKLAKQYYEINVDALIIQDLGLYYRLKKEIPNFEIHASTQMHIHNLQGIKNAKILGFNRVVVARETSYDKLKEFCKEGIDIEYFVHGALCVSYSGQCLMSSFIKDRSANRGMCAQCCRLKYFYKDKDKLIKSDTYYLLSPKDLMLINDIPKLIKSGVSSLKIEGRMKSPLYVAYVTKLYRQAIDAYYENKEFELTLDDLNNLKVIYNRGFNNSYFNNNNKDIFNNIRPNNIGIRIGEVISKNNNKFKVKLSYPLKQFDGIRVLNNKEDTGFIVNKLYKDSKLVSCADIGDNIELDLKDNVDIGAIVVKTSDKVLEDKILNYKILKKNIDLSIIFKPNINISISCKIYDKIFNYNSNIIPENALKSPLSIESIKSSFNKTNDHPFIINNFNIDYDVSFLNIKDLNDLRRDFYNKLEEYIINSYKRNIKSNQLSYKYSNNLISNDNDEIIIKDNKYKDYSLLPLINNESNYPNNKSIITEFGGILLNEDKIAYHTLNIYNSYAYEFLLSLGFKKIILSTELNDENIKSLIEYFYKRNNFKITPYLLEEGYIDLMNIYDHPFNDKYNLITDRTIDYKIIHHKEYTSLSIDYKKVKKHNNTYNIVKIL